LGQSTTAAIQQEYDPNTLFNAAWAKPVVSGAFAPLTLAQKVIN